MEVEIFGLSSKKNSLCGSILTDQNGLKQNENVSRIVLESPETHYLNKNEKEKNKPTTFHQKYNRTNYHQYSLFPLIVANCII